MPPKMPHPSKFKKINKVQNVKLAKSDFFRAPSQL